MSIMHYNCTYKTISGKVILFYYFLSPPEWCFILCGQIDKKKISGKLYQSEAQQINKTSSGCKSASNDKCVTVLHTNEMFIGTTMCAKINWGMLSNDTVKVKIPYELCCSHWPTFIRNVCLHWWKPFVSTGLFWNYS